MGCFGACPLNWWCDWAYFQTTLTPLPTNLTNNHLNSQISKWDNFLMHRDIELKLCMVPYLLQKWADRKNQKAPTTPPPYPLPNTCWLPQFLPDYDENWYESPFWRETLKMSQRCGYAQFQLTPTILPTYPLTTPIADFGNFDLIWQKLMGKC